MELFKYSVAFLVLILASDVLARPGVFGDLSSGSTGHVLDPLGLFRPAIVGRNSPGQDGSLTASVNPLGLLGISATLSHPKGSSFPVVGAPLAAANEVSKLNGYGGYGGLNVAANEASKLNGYGGYGGLNAAANEASKFNTYGGYTGSNANANEASKFNSYSGYSGSNTNANEASKSTNYGGYSGSNGIANAQASASASATASAAAQGCTCGGLH